MPGRDDLARRADEALFVMELEPSPTGSGQRVRMRFVEGSGFSVEKTLELALQSIERVLGEMETLVARLRAAGKNR